MIEKVSRMGTHHKGTVHKDAHKSADKSPEKNEYPYQLTQEVENKNEILFAEEQLMRNGAKEEVDYEWRESGTGKWSLWTLRSSVNP